MNRRLSLALLLLLTGLLAYPASLGPTAWVVRHTSHNWALLGALETFYYPLEVLCRHSPAVEKVLEAYVELFSH